MQKNWIVSICRVGAAQSCPGALGKITQNRYTIHIENRKYREELKESLRMNLFSPFKSEKGVQSVQIM